MELLDKIQKFETLPLESRTFITHFYEMSKKYDNKEISESTYALMLLHNRYGFTNTQAYLTWNDLIERLDGDIDPLTEQPIESIRVAIQIIKGADDTLSIRDVITLIKDWLPFFRECWECWSGETDMLLNDLMFSWVEAFQMLLAEGYTYSVADTILTYLYAVQEDVEFKS